MRVTEIDDVDLLNTLTVEVPAALEPESERPYRTQQTQLPTPSRSPSTTPVNHLQAPTSLPTAPGNQAQRGNEISRDFNPQNIIEGSQTRTRKAAYATALEKNNELGGYCSSFVTATRAGHTTKPLRLHQDALPPLPTSWKQMLKHEHSIEFKKAADKEFDTLLQKGTFEYIEKSKIDSEA